MHIQKDEKVLSKIYKFQQNIKQILNEVYLDYIKSLKNEQTNLNK